MNYRVLCDRPAKRPQYQGERCRCEVARLGVAPLSVEPVKIRTEVRPGEILARCVCGQWYSIRYKILDGAQEVA